MKLRSLIVVASAPPLFAAVEERNPPMWRILVPVRDNNGRRIRDEKHIEWEQRVINVSGGWTIHPEARGAWRPSGREPQFEDMRPVDIICMEPQIEAIIQMTGEFFEQQAVLAYKVSDDVRMRYFPAEGEASRSERGV